MPHPQQTGLITKWIDAPTKSIDIAGAAFV